jgi:Protein of unknown function (DUF3987)
MQPDKLETLKGIPLDHAKVSFAPLDMGIIDGNRKKPPELPMDVFGEWANWISTVGEKKSAPRDYVAAGLLAAASTVIGNARWVSPWDGWKEPPVLWVAAVGDPSSGKSPALDEAFSFLRSLENDMADDFPEKLMDYERIKEIARAKMDDWKGDVKEAVKANRPAPPMPEGAFEPDPPQLPRISVTDTTPEALGHLLAANPKGLLYRRDELAGWIGNFDRYGGGGERTFFLEGFGGRDYNIDRVKQNKEPIRIRHLTIGVIGGIQPEKLADMVLRGSDDGFVPRFLMCWPEAVPPKRPDDMPVSARYHFAMQRLQSLEMGHDEKNLPTPKVIILSEEAACLFDQWRQENDRHSKEVYGLMLGHYGKLPGIVLRLALTLEYLSWCLGSEVEPQSISRQTLGRALDLVDGYFKPMAERVYGDAALPPQEKGAAMLARRIKKDRSLLVNANDIRRYWKLPGLRESGTVKSALLVLVDLGWLCKAVSANTKGKPKENYHVNPAVFGGL